MSFVKIFSCQRCLIQNWPKISQRRLHTKSYLFATVTNVQRTSKSIDYFKEMVVSLDDNEKLHLRTALEEIDACNPEGMHASGDSQSLEVNMSFVCFIQVQIITKSAHTN